MASGIEIFRNLKNPGQDSQPSEERGFLLAHPDPAVSLGTRRIAAFNSQKSSSVWKELGVASNMTIYSAPAPSTPLESVRSGPWATAQKTALPRLFSVFLSVSRERL